MLKISSFICFAVFILIPIGFSQNNGNNIQLYSQKELSSDHTSLPSYKNINDWSQVADDFTASSDWKIYQIVVVGDDIDTSSVTGFNIYIYTNKNGFPDILVYSAETQPYTTLFLNYFIWKVRITLQIPANLNAGDYFISIQYYPANSTSTGWYWTQVNGSFGGIAMFRNYSAYCAAWAPLYHCLPTSYTDMYFELYGSANTVGVEDNTQLPQIFALDQNYPNPFNPSTKISWQSPVSSHQTIKVYDVLGNEIGSLVDEYKPAGNYEVEFDASNLSSGVYLYKLQAGNFVETKKMILMK